MTVLNEIFAEVRVSGEVTAEAAQRARRAVYGSGTAVAPADIETMLRIEEASDRSDPAWEALLVEATVDHLVHESDPVDTVSDAGAGWLYQHIATDGLVKTVRELEVLIRVIEEARSAPEPLVVLALRQVRAAVVEGDGPLAGIVNQDPGRITRDEAALIRRILYAFGSHTDVAITRAEAEIIFDINDAATAGENDPEWTDLFVKTIANCILSASGFRPPPREVALAEDDLGAPDPRPDVGGFLASMALHSLRGVMGAYALPRFSDRTPSPRPAAEVGAATKDGAAWLAKRIGKDGRLDENEKALLRFIRDEAPALHPTLMELIAKAA